MPFKKTEVEDLLVKTGRMCCICNKLHRVQTHHIVPEEEGGSNDIDNAIPLCSYCHEEVHIRPSSGILSRSYSVSEMKGHRERTIEKAKSASQWQPGNPVAKQDEELILFYARCLDRPAFQTYFHRELSFCDFDQAMEDALLSINTGYTRFKDGAVIESSKGKIHLVKTEWREKMNEIVAIIQEVRQRFQESLGLNEMLINYHRRRQTAQSYDWAMEQAMTAHFQNDTALNDYMNKRRKDAIEIMNILLLEIGHAPIGMFG